MVLQSTPEMFKSELLSPAGTLKSMKYAFAYGADAVYIGQPRYSLRVRNNEFNKLENIQEAINYAHNIGKKVYLAVNLSPHNDKIRSFIKDMQPIIAMKPDALIMSDPGLIMLIRQAWPDIEIHLSVQANVVNWASVQFWADQGISRVILSRELSIEEVSFIRQKVPQMELEVFVHGALCIAYSGRCLLSGYITKRDPNQGACTNTCRWKYTAHEAKETLEGNTVAIDPAVEQHAQIQKQAPDKGKQDMEQVVYLLQEENRPGEYMPAYEDEHGTYIMNSKDLRAVQHIAQFQSIGVHSLKIEGRTKSHFYVARTAQIYREAIDNAYAGKAFDWQLMEQLEGLSNRGYTEGFYRRHPPSEYQNYYENNANTGTQQFIGEISAHHPQNNTCTIIVKNRFSLGDSLELMSPKGNIHFTLNYMQSAKDNQSIDVAKGSGWIVNIPAPLPVEQMAACWKFALLMRNIYSKPSISERG